MDLQEMKMKNKKEVLTVRQSEIFKYIKRFQAKNGYPPSRSEICDQFNFKSRNAAQDHLLGIEKRGWIKIIPSISRGIKIL